MGEAGITWKNENGKFKAEIEVPIGSTATVYIPSGEINSLKESGEPVKQAKGVKLLSAGKDTITLAVESGKYQFEIGRK